MKSKPIAKRIIGVNSVSDFSLVFTVCLFCIVLLSLEVLLDFGFDTILEPKIVIKCENELHLQILCH